LRFASFNVEGHSATTDRPQIEVVYEQAMAPRSGST
jgi:hypothetical protein